MQRVPASAQVPSQSHTSWFHRAWVPAATQAGHPVVPRASKRANQVCLGEQAARTIQGSDPSSFQSACPSKHCESPTGHSCRGWGGRGGDGQEEVRRLLSPPTARGCVCSLPSGEAVWGGNRRGHTPTSSSPPPPRKAAPVPHRPLPPVAQLSMSWVSCRVRVRRGLGVGWGGGQA